MEESKLTSEADFEMKCIALKACTNSKDIVKDAKAIYEWLKESANGK